jgi:CTP synthase (UTP-ammonia lyase)
MNNYCKGNRKGFKYQNEFLDASTNYNLNNWNISYNWLYSNIINRYSLKAFQSQSVQTTSKVTTQTTETTSQTTQQSQPRIIDVEIKE